MLMPANQTHVNMTADATTIYKAFSAVAMDIMKVIHVLVGI